MVGIPRSSPAEDRSSLPAAPSRRPESRRAPGSPSGTVMPA
jgi:hypothetical protein